MIKNDFKTVFSDFANSYDSQDPKRNQASNELINLFKKQKKLRENTDEDVRSLMSDTFSQNSNSKTNYKKFYLNGDPKMAQKVMSIIQGQESGINLFSNDKNEKMAQGKVKRVEIWTFEKRAYFS